MTLVADEMKVTGMPKRRLEAGAAFAEIDLVGDAGGDHPLQRAVDRSPAEPCIIPANEIVQLVRRHVALLTEKDRDDAVAL